MNVLLTNKKWIPFHILKENAHFSSGEIIPIEEKSRKRLQPSRKPYFYLHHIKPKEIENVKKWLKCNNCKNANWCIFWITLGKHICLKGRWGYIKTYQIFVICILAVKSFLTYHVYQNHTSKNLDWIVRNKKYQSYFYYFKFCQCFNWGKNINLNAFCNNSIMQKAFYAI